MLTRIEPVVAVALRLEGCKMASSSPRTGTRKRSAPDTPDEEPPSKKIHPFFLKNRESESQTPFQWQKPLGPKGTCLHATHLSPRSSTRVALFDLDGTIIKAQFPPGSTGSQWQWWHSSVPGKLAELSKSGYAIVIVTNQGIKPAFLKHWKEKVVLIATSLAIPFRLFAATARDGYRKPMPGMWLELEKIFKADGITIDTSSSFFIGDAAGRQYSDKKTDFSSTDRKFALNIGVPFMTPEEYFLQLRKHTNYKLPGFHVSSLPDLPLVTPTSLPILPRSKEQEIVLFCGYPALGKTHFYKEYFQPAGYVHINQDTLKTRDKCVKTAREALRNQQSCVIDNTNRDRKTRQYYIALAKEFGISIRCFLFVGSLDLAWHNNLYRTYLQPLGGSQQSPRDLVPYGAFTGFRDQFEGPALTEGFSEIRKVNWRFEGSDEERRYWSMWLQIDGT